MLKKSARLHCVHIHESQNCFNVVLHIPLKSCCPWCSDACSTPVAARSTRQKRERGFTSRTGGSEGTSSVCCEVGSAASLDDQLNWLLRHKHSLYGLFLPQFFAREKESTVILVTQTKLPANKPPADCRPTPGGPKAPGCPHLVTPSCSPATKRTPLRRHKREDSSISCTRLLEHCL